MYCEKCGTKLDDNAKFCIKCGTKQISIEQKKESSVDISIKEDSYKKENIKEKSRRKTVVISLAVIVFVSAILIFLGLDKRGTDKTGEDGLTNSENTYDNYETSENEDYYEEYSDNEVEENIFVSDSDVVNIEGISSFNKMNGGNLTEQGGWVYYISDRADAIYKIDPDGNQHLVLANLENTARDISIVGDWIYWLESGDLYKVRTDGEQRSLVVENCNDYYIYDQYIYYGENIQESADGVRVQIKQKELNSNTIVWGNIWYFGPENSSKYRPEVEFIGTYENKIYLYAKASNKEYYQNDYFYGLYCIDGYNYTIETIEEEQEIYWGVGGYCQYAIDSQGILWIQQGVSGRSLNWIYEYDLKTRDLTKREDGVHNLNKDTGIRTLNLDKSNDSLILATQGGIGKVNKNNLNINSGELFVFDKASSVYHTDEYIYYEVNADDYVDDLYRITYFGEKWEKVSPDE